MPFFLEQPSQQLSFQNDAEDIFLSKHRLETETAQQLTPVQEYLPPLPSRDDCTDRHIYVIIIKTKSILKGAYLNLFPDEIAF